MESSVKISEKRRLRKEKRQRELKLLSKVSKSPSRNLGIRKPITKKEKGKEIKKIREQYIGSFIQGLCGKHISFNSSQRVSKIRGKGFTEYGHCGMDLFEQTIDLCDTDGSVDNSSPNILLLSSCEITQKRDPVIDVCQDKTGQNEVIDLTETINATEIECSAHDGREPTVIDISEDDPKDQQNFKAENDEILVIGTFNKNSDFTRKSEVPSFISLSNRRNSFNSLVNCSKKLKKRYYNKRLVLDKIDNKNISQLKRNLREGKESSDKAAKVAKVGENIYVNSPVTLPSKGLRPIIIDGSNVAFIHSNCNFSCKRLEICINYFKEKGHKVTAFVPQFRLNSHRSDNPQLLRKLERQGDVVLTPSKKVDGRNIVPYDDRFIVQTAVLKGGIIVSRDNFNDLLKENPAWAETIKYRTLAFTWVDDVLMFPKDPLGEYGPTLEDFLRFH